MLIWFKHHWPLGDSGLMILGTTAIGLVYQVVAVVLLLFGMFLPFIATDAVARDYKQRVHELLMTTTIPNWAYIWGRYLASLLVNFISAMLMLLALYAMDFWLHLTNTAYPAPNLRTILMLWVLIVLPPVVMVSAISFTLGILFPRLTAIMKLAVVVGWIMLTAMGSCPGARRLVAAPERYTCRTDPGRCIPAGSQHARGSHLSSTVYNYELRRNRVPITP